MVKKDPTNAAEALARTANILAVDTVMMGVSRLCL